MITFNGIPVVQVLDGEGGGCGQCCFSVPSGGCLMARMDEWDVEEEREQFGGDCAENNAHYELDEKE